VGSNHEMSTDPSWLH